MALPSLAGKLSSLPNRCYLIGEGQRANLIWSEGDFLALCEHMLNGNELDHFLAAWKDRKSGEPRFAKAFRGVRADRRARWAFNSINGSGAQTSIGFYPSNRDKESAWGGLDFDAHDGDMQRARNWSLQAFQLLLRHPELYLILCASGNGYHLFILTKERNRVSDWIVLLEQVCAWIGAPIAEGRCEIFPNRSAESQRIGRGIRAPGTLNPKTGEPSLIEAETVRPLLQLLPRTWSLCVGKANSRPPRETQSLSLHERTNNYFLPCYSITTESLVEKLLAAFAIERRGTRNAILMKMVGHLIHKFGHEPAERIAREHYRRYSHNVSTKEAEHMRKFTAAWHGMQNKITASFREAEKRKFESLRSEHQREAFFIVRAFAGVAKQKGDLDFIISRSSLADRLSVTEQGAGEIVKHLCEIHVIERTQLPRPQRSCGRYRWMAHEQ